MEKNTLNWLLRYTGTENRKSELIKALTHKSFYESETDHKNSNGRFVFLGMYALKGKVCELIFQFINGSGTQLQHYLGNIFKNDLLEKIYFKYKLYDLIRFGKNFKALEHKHIFVYGFLGYIYKYMDEKKLNSFLFQNFMAETQHLIPAINKNKDVKSQCEFLTKMLYNTKPEFTVKKTENQLFLASLSIKGCEICISESKSYKYARKKTYKNALLILGEQALGELEKNPDYHIRVEERIKKAEEQVIAKKKEKADTYLKKIEEKKAERQKKKEITAKLAKEKDEARKKAKARAKARAEQKRKTEAANKQALASMSTNKRRHLQDKMK